MKIVLTGAAGKLGSRLRRPLAALADELVSSDCAAIGGTPAANETFVQADLVDLPAMRRLCAGADTIVHFGGIGDEAPFDDILAANIIGSYNIWQAAREGGARRVVYASSVHAVGMHPKTTTLGVDCAHRPDTYYGLSKCFAEDLARLYWDRCGIESVCIRIYSCSTVTSARSLGSWLSYDDLFQVVTRAIDTPVVGFTIVYGVSDNDRRTIDNSGASHLGYRPKDNAEVYATEILAQAGPANPQDPAQATQGGPFATVELGSSGLAVMNVPDKPLSE